jgi:hypothetical protein
MTIRLSSFPKNFFQTVENERPIVCYVLVWLLSGNQLVFVRSEREKEKEISLSEYCHRWCENDDRPEFFCGESLPSRKQEKLACSFDGGLLGGASLHPSTAPKVTLPLLKQQSL